MREQPTAHPTRPGPTVLVSTVNGVPIRDYLHHPDPDPSRLLVGEVDGYQVVWAPARHQTSCARHPHLGGCPCLHQLAALANPEALAGWYRTLTRRQRQQLRSPPGPRRRQTRAGVAGLDLGARPPPLPRRPPPLAPAPRAPTPPRPVADGSAGPALSAPSRRPVRPPVTIGAGGQPTRS